MKLILLLLDHFKASFFVVCALSLFSAGLTVLIIAFINQQMIQSASVTVEALIQFAGLLIALFIISTCNQLKMTATGHRLVYQLRRTLVKKVLDTDLERLESLGPARIMAALNTDIRNITSAFITLPITTYGSILILAGFLYLAWLSPALFLAVSACLSLTVMVAWLLLKGTHQQVCFARDAEGRLYENYRALIEGRKELALNRFRARCLYEQEFDPNALDSLHSETKADIFNGLNENWVNMMILAAIGTTFYLSHAYDWADVGTASTYALVILFLRTPLTAVVSSIPRMVAGNVSLSNLNALELPDYQAEFAPPGAKLGAQWNSLNLQAIEYAYPGENTEKGFRIGPLNFTLRRGETVFLIGGNGSGKSTLARILTGLYRPSAGQIRLDRLLITENHRSAFHRLFSTVFSDFFLFDQVLDRNGRFAESETFEPWLHILQMNRKVQFDQGRLQRKNLSQGQRKRMALLLAILEDRPILLLDEWAADQDPAFRSIFYHQVLPKLKAAGKTIVAITHDERYFHVADRLLKVDQGQLLELEGFRSRSQDDYLGFEEAELCNGYQPLKT